MSQSLRIRRVVGQLATLPLACPLVTSWGRVEERRILLITCELECLESGRIIAGYGEAAPLPGWTKESVEECMSAVGGVDFATKLCVVDRLDSRLEAFADLPSLRFGLEVAILDAMARADRVTLRHLLASQFGTGEPCHELAVQATFGVSDLDSTCELVESAVADGATAVKLKVGKSSISEDLERVLAVRDRCPKVAIRLDANGAWSREDARAFLDEAAPLRLDLVEQPVAADDVEGLLALARDGSAPIAVDEGLYCGDERRQSAPRMARCLVDEGIDALVLKPMALGGLVASKKLADYAEKKGVTVVWSTLLESAVGRRAIAQLAAALPGMEGPHGLATGAWFEVDSAPEPDLIEGGRLRLNDRPGIGFIPRLELLGSP